MTGGWPLSVMMHNGCHKNRPTGQRNPDQCDSDYADLPCYTDIVGPSTYELLKQKQNNIVNLMSCYIHPYPKFSSI